MTKIYTLKNYGAVARIGTAPYMPALMIYVVHEDVVMDVARNFDACLVSNVTSNYVGHLRTAYSLKVKGFELAQSKKDTDAPPSNARAVADVIPHILQDQTWRYLLPLNTYAEDQTTNTNENRRPLYEVMRQAPYPEEMDTPIVPMNTVIRPKTAQAERSVERYPGCGDAKLTGVPRTAWLAWPDLITGDAVTSPVCLKCPYLGRMTVGGCYVGDYDCVAAVNGLVLTQMSVHLRKADELLKTLDVKVY